MLIFLLHCKQRYKNQKKLNLLTYIEMILMVEKGIRGRINHIDVQKLITNT